MLVLAETSLGFCLFKVTDKGKLSSEDVWEEFESPQKANKFLKLKALHRFTSTASAVEEITAIQESKVGKGLKQFLSEEVVEKGKGKEVLVVADSKLGRSINKKLGIEIAANTSLDLFRGIRSQLTSLLDGLDPKDLATMSLDSTASRFKLKFSPDKVDTMIVQAIALLDDLDKEINIYAMRVKEWYGWHFPEMAKIIVDNIAYARVIKTMGFRTNAATTDFAAVLPEDLEQTVKAAAEISMGTEISDSDITHIHALCDQVISISAYRNQLWEYLRNRMNAIAPNLTALVGELVGARLISHAGSLLSLAKHPASTVQILGAEKALFRALKTKHDTPKYGLIYHASLIGQAPPKLKGKMARMVATKAALSIRVDALTDTDGKSEPTAPSIGLENRAKLESRLRALEQGLDASGVRGLKNGRNQQRFQMSGETKTYNSAADDVDLVPTQREPVEAAVQAALSVKEEKAKAKQARRAEKKAKEAETSANGAGDSGMDVDGETKEAKKEKKRKRRESAADGDEIMTEAKDETEEEKKAKKKARKAEKAALEGAETNGDVSSSKKKRRKSENETAPCDGLTLILACRNEQRALAARQQLLEDFDSHVHKERTRPGYNGLAERFRDNLDIRIHTVDTANLSSVFRFARELAQKYPYISHLICNAGGAVFTGLDWIGALYQIACQPVIGVTVTEFKIQRAGVIGPDGLGLVWQSNVFSHYVLSRLLEPLFALYAEQSRQPSRVLWMSSLEASPTAFSRDDWQCVKAKKAYEATKYQIDLISHELYLRSLRNTKPSVIRHITVHPGISHSELTKALIVSVLEYAKLVYFYVVRLFGSRNHTINTAAAAISAVHLSLLSIFLIPDKLSTFTHTRFAKRSHRPTLFEDSTYTHSLYATGLQTMADVKASEASEKPSPVKFSSEVDRWGNARVGVYTIIDYKQHESDGAFLVDKCESLFQTCRELEAQGKLAELPQVASTFRMAKTGNGTTVANSLKD
ncbi:hypothetical protein EUX98_g466 [Antrodiella citrinella]|uniref:Nucleolar protein 58 n=1 Tax=Antrodiella citrinella TaxID=2447956 RepID=A0A4S4N436_9APHY|nr:hypothetical protein EUX98_g466 [Antrodiella citrinella]